ncbi:unnamed protein product, partial [Rotaria magnacalcarata]
MIVEPIVENVKETISNFDLNYIEDDETNSAMNEIETANKISEETSYNLNDEYDIDSGMGSFDNQVEPECTENVKYDVNDTHNLNTEMHCMDSEPVGFQVANYNVSSQYDESDKIDTYDNKTEPVGSESVNYNYQDEYDKYSEKNSVDSEVNPETEEFETPNCNFSYQCDEVNTSNNEPESEPGYRYEDNTMNEWYKEILARTENEQNIHLDVNYKDSDDENSKKINTKIENFKQIRPVVNSPSDEKVGIHVTIGNIEPSTKAKVNNKVSCIKPKARNVVKDIYKSEISSNKKVKASKKGGKTEPITSIIENDKYNLKSRAELSVK